MKQIRKPRPFVETGMIGPFAVIGLTGHAVFIDGDVLFQPDIKRLAEWLLKVDRWINQQEKKRDNGSQPAETK